MNRPVLYVEDEEDDAIIMQIAWERAGMGCPLAIVADGQQALDYINGQNSFSDRQNFPTPRLVLLDLNLPRISGIEVLKTIRQKLDKSQLPVVMFSSSDSPRDKTAVEAAGANLYLVKPAGLNHLVAALRSLAEFLHSCAKAKVDLD